MALFLIFSSISNIVFAGSKVKDKLLTLYHKGKVEASWIFPLSVGIKTRDLERQIRSNPAQYKKVADWIGEDEW